MLEEKLLKNNPTNMETKLKPEAEVLEGSPETSELASRVLKNQEAEAEVQQALIDEKKVPGQYNKALESVKTEKNPEQESSKRRRAYIKAGFELIANALKAELGKNLFSRGLVGKKEIQDCLDQVNFRSEHLEKNEEVDSMNWTVALNQAKFVSKKELLPQLEALKSIYLYPEDLEKLDPKKVQMEAQIKSSSMGASGDRVQF